MSKGTSENLHHLQFFKKKPPRERNWANNLFDFILEIQLDQNKKEDCKKFIDDNIDDLQISDFSLHSIGVILFKYNKVDIFKKFISDFLLKIRILSLPKKLFTEVVIAKENLNLVFDDAYQYCIAKNFGLRLVTIDKNFRRVEDIEVLFI